MERLEEWAAKYGKEGLFEISLGGRSAVVVCCHEFVELVHARRPYRVQRTERFQRSQDLLRGVFTAEGETWRMHRRLTAPAFKAPSVAGYLPAVQGVLDVLLGRVAGAADSGARVNVTAMLSAFTMDVISKVAFGHEFGALKVEEGGSREAGLIAKFFVALNHRIVSPVEWWHWPLVSRLDRAPAVVRELDTVIEELIGKPREEGSPPTVLDKLLHPQAEKMPWADLVGNMKTLFLAGVETTTTALVWALHEVARRPELQDRVAAEATRVLGDGPAKDMEQLESLDLARAVWSETLRLRSSVPMLLFRTAEPITLGGRVLPEGTELLVLTRYSQDRHIEASHPGCPALGLFYPERWLDAKGRFRSGGAMDVTAFGSGARVCLGRRLADLEGVATIAEVLRRYRVGGASADVKEITQGTQCPDRPIELTFASRVAAPLGAIAGA